MKATPTARCKSFCENFHKVPALLLASTQNARSSQSTVWAHSQRNRRYGFSVAVPILLVVVLRPAVFRVVRAKTPRLFISHPR
jgi:hypothetical protein